MQITGERCRCGEIIDAICGLNWEGLSQNDLLSVATGYYYFSIQFRESLRVARSLYPDDVKLQQLEAAECDTDNLSPWPGVVHVGEKVDHDEFVRRLLLLSPIDEVRKQRLDSIGESYLQNTRAMDPETRAGSIASYEDGGLERVFRAILRSRDWEDSALLAFRHFLVEHIRFDSDEEEGHGALSRHIIVEDSRIAPMWAEFKELLANSAPNVLAESKCSAS